MAFLKRFGPHGLVAASMLFFSVMLYRNQAPFAVYGGVIGALLFVLLLYEYRARFERERKFFDALDSLSFAAAALVGLVCLFVVWILRR